MNILCCRKHDVFNALNTTKHLVQLKTNQTNKITIKTKINTMLKIYTLFNSTRFLIHSEAMTQVFLLQNQRLWKSQYINYVDRNLNFERWRSHEEKSNWAFLFWKLCKYIIIFFVRPITITAYDCCVCVYLWRILEPFTIPIGLVGLNRTSQF